jgi:antitoxin FitA
MVSITIRDVPEEVRSELAARAARSGRSMQEFVLGLLTDYAARPSQADALARIRARARTLPSLDEEAVARDLTADRR